LFTEDFSRNLTRECPNPLIICSFDLNEISLKILFNIQQLIHCRWKNYETNSMHPYSSRAYQWYQKPHNRPHDLGDLNMTNKTKQTNKQTNSLHR